MVAAGPGSGKTKVLVHKLASLMLLEDVKHEQLLMVTFSRAAATEFRQRLYALIGNAAGFVEIKTFHSYCFDLLGRVGNLSSSQTVVKDASEMIKNGDVEIGRITKTVLVIDEAQDMDEYEYELVSALIERNDDLRVIAVGDDDQNIYEFRGSDSRYFESFLKRENSRKYELLDNYRSAKAIVNFANCFVRKINGRLKSASVISQNDLNGKVELIQCRSRNLEEPVTAKAVEGKKNGTVCILTITNNDALRVAGLLNKKGVRAKLIQSNDEFDLYNMIELRFFMMRIEKDLSSPIIDEERWNEAKNKLKQQYKDSSNLKLCLDILETFEWTNKKKYKSDLELFLHESRIEDFFQSEYSEVVVSTVHKSKGREFDEVLILLDDTPIDTDEKKRMLYVGMTRAKKSLSLFYHQPGFSSLIFPYAKIQTDNNDYQKPEEILMQLSYKDVYLDFFKKEKEIIRKCICGRRLSISNDGLNLMYREEQYKVVHFSRKFMEKVEQYKRQGYYMTSASIRFIVGWTDKEEGKEYPIILPDIYFCTGR